MAKKKKEDSADELGEFDDWFADGESDDFWADDKDVAATAASDAEKARAEADRIAAEEAAKRAAGAKSAGKAPADGKAAAEKAAAAQKAAAAEAAAAEAAAAQAAAAEAAAAEAAAAEAAAAEAAAAEAAAAEAAAAEAAAAEAAAATVVDEAATRLAAEKARAAAMGGNPTIVADMDDGFPEPETEIAGEADDETEVADEVDDADDGDEEEEDFASAEDFVGDMPDPTMVLRREAETEDDPPSAPADGLYDADEIAKARAERAARRAETAAPPPPEVPPTPTEAPVAPVRIAPSVPSARAADRWAEGATALEREAISRAGSSDAAGLWAAAGRIHFERLGNWERAEELFAQAHDAGHSDPEFLKAYADVVANKGDFDRLRDLLTARAGTTSGVLAAEALQDAALVERNSLRRPEEATALLEQAIDKDPEDWFALRLLRELHYRAQAWEQLADVLEKMAALVTGPRAARVHVERGRVLEERLSDLERALSAYEAALVAAPDHTPAFLAVERMARVAGDNKRLSALYGTEADRTQGADSLYWRTRGLRMARLAEGVSDDQVAEHFTAVMGDGAGVSPELRREHQVFLSSAGRWTEVAAALQAEADASEGTQKAWALFRLGRVQEQHLELNDAAVASYQAAASADPAAGPAVEAAANLLGASGKHRELVALLESLLPDLDDPNLTVTTLYRMGELCEGPLEDQDGAQTWFERILDTAPGYLPALEGLERVYTRLAAWDKLAAVYEQRAILAEDPPGIALQLHRAGAVCEFRLADIERARDFYRRALEQVPDFPPSMDAYVRILESDGDWAGLARTLRLASESTKDSNEMVSLTYRSARILADRVDDKEQAMALLRRCLELSPGFLPAIQLLRDLASSGQAWQDVYDLHRLEADAAEDLDRRHWRMLVAAEAATHTDTVDAAAVIAEILEEDAGHESALRLLEEQALASGDAHEQLAVYQRMAFGAEDDATRTRLAVRIAELAGDAGDAVTAMNAVSEVIAAEGDDRPLAALSRLAESANYWEEAQRALLATADGATQPELARIQEAWIDDASTAARTWRELLERDPGDVEAAAGLERALARAGTREGLAQAHGVLADHLPDPAVAAVHALLAGHLFEAEEDIDQAIVYYDKAFAARPVAGKAFDALRRVLSQRRDGAGLAELFGRLETSAPLELAAALEEAGAEAEAAAGYRAVLSEDGLSDTQRMAVLVRLEQDLVELEQWSELFEVLGQRAAITNSPEEKSAIEARRRWVLAEHLAETDEAWDFYRQLHEEAPQDREVLEALARIAGARGETGLAIQYLGGLADSSTDDADAARYQRRIAEAHLKGDDGDAAREALLRALDHDPGDVESLRLLKELATKAEDWPAVVGALAREATVLDGDDQVACYREIAATWQDRISNADVAADAWRKVLEVAPDDPDALDRLIGLSRESGSWQQFVEYGSARVRSLDGDPRASLMTELGRVQLEQFHQEDEAVRMLDAASRGDSPSLEAAQLLERIHASRGQWDRVADAIVRQSRATADVDERVALLVRAAEIRSDTLHDRAGASEIYAEVLTAKADNVPALRFRGDYLFEEGKLEEAVEAYMALDGWEETLDLDDFDDRMDAALYQFRYAESLRRLGRNDDALARYQKALSFNEAHLPSLEAVGPILIDTEQWDQAGKTYRQILQLIGGQGDAERLCRTYTNLGRIELHQGTLDKAKKRFTKALDIKPNDISALQGMAAVLFERKDWNNLLNVYNNIIYHAQEPADVVDAYITKGFVLDAKMNLPDKAAQHYEKSLAFNPAQPESLLRLAELALRRQDWAEAGSLADRGLALELERKDLEAGLLLAKTVAHGSLGDDAAAGQARSTALERDVTLSADIGDDTTTAQVHDVLKARLQAAP